MSSVLVNLLRHWIGEDLLLKLAEIRKYPASADVTLGRWFERNHLDCDIVGNFGVR
jgi:hypothetical protein